MTVRGLDPADGYITEFGGGRREVAAAGRVIVRGPVPFASALVMLEEHTPAGRAKWHVLPDGEAREL